MYQQHPTMLDCLSGVLGLLCRRKRSNRFNMLLEQQAGKSDKSAVLRKANFRFWNLRPINRWDLGAFHSMCSRNPGRFPPLGWREPRDSGRGLGRSSLEQAGRCGVFGKSPEQLSSTRLGLDRRGGATCTSKMHQQCNMIQRFSNISCSSPKTYTFYTTVMLQCFHTHQTTTGVTCLGKGTGRAGEKPIVAVVRGRQEWPGDKQNRHKPMGFASLIFQKTFGLN